jgi:hypothetical protein
VCIDISKLLALMRRDRPGEYGRWLSEEPRGTPDLGKTARAHLRGHGRLHPRSGRLARGPRRAPPDNGVMSSDQALLGFKAAIDAALGRGSQALTKWIAGFK